MIAFFDRDQFWKISSLQQIFHISMQIAKNKHIADTKLGNLTER